MNERDDLSYSRTDLGSMYWRRTFENDCLRSEFECRWFELKLSVRPGSIPSLSWLVHRLTRKLTRNLHTSTLDRFVLDALSATPSVQRPDLSHLIRQYLTHSGKVLGTQLAYEPRPSSSRRISFSDNNSCNIHLIAHVVCEGDRNKITLSSGFAVDSSDGQSILVTCAHTLEEVRHMS